MSYLPSEMYHILVSAGSLACGRIYSLILGWDGGWGIAVLCVVWSRELDLGFVKLIDRPPCLFVTSFPGSCLGVGLGGRGTQELGN